MFRTRLDFLMHLTDTGNTELGDAAIFTPSYISRLRVGKRSLPNNSTFLRSAAAYLAARVTTREQQDALCQEMRIPFFPPDRSEQIDLLQLWLRGGNAADFFGITATPDTERDKLDAEPVNVAFPPDNLRIYYNSAGKREAVLRLAREMIDNGKPQILYSYRDSPNLDWMMEDSAFQEQWKRAITDIEKTGSKYVLIVDRYVDIQTAILGIEFYLPFIARGSMDVLYYPKQRDHLFHLYFFAARDTAAILYTGLSAPQESAPYLYIAEQPAVRQYTQELERLVQQCVGGPHTCTSGISSDFWRYALTLDHFSKAPIHSYWNGPSAVTIPSCVVQSFSSRIGIHLSPVFFRFEEQAKSHLEYYPIYDYICLPAPASQSCMEIPFAGDTLLGASGLCYTKSEFDMHIRHLICLLEHYESYHLLLCGDHPFLCDAYISDNGKMVTISREMPHTVRVDTDSTLSYSVTSYFQEVTRTYRELPRKETISLLKQYL